MRRSSSLVLVVPLLIAGIVGGFVLYRFVTTRNGLPRAKSTTQDSPENPASSFDGPTYLDPGTSPNKKPLVDASTQPKDDRLVVQIDEDFGALLQRIRSLEVPKGGTEREAYLRALRERLQSDPTELERFISFTGTLRDWHSQRIALILLGRVNSPRAIEYLVSVVADSDDLQARRLAIWALGQNGDINNPVVLDNSNLVDVDWASTLSDNRSLPLLRLLEQGRVPDEIIVELINILGSHQVRGSDHNGEPPEAVQRIDAIVLRLASSSATPAKVRYAAVNALTDANKDQVQTLCRSLVETESDQELRVYAADKLDLRDSEGLEFGLRMLAKEHDEEIRLRLVLRLPANDRTLEVFDRTVFSDTSERVRMNCVVKLSSLGDRGRKIIERIASEDPSENVRHTAKTYLSRMDK